MKTYKTFGIVAAVWAALACSVTLTTSAADGEGDIWYIGRADGGTYGLSTPLSMDADNNSALPGQPKVLTAGQEVWFRFRLLNRNYYDKYAGGITGPIDWYLKYNGPNNTNAAPPMKVGVWVSGRRQWADVVNNRFYQANDYFSDLVCSYKVQPGDFGLLTLACGPEYPDSAGYEAPTDPTAASAYSLMNYGPTLWQMLDTHTTNACNFWIASKTSSSIVPAGGQTISECAPTPGDNPPGANLSQWPRDVDMSQAHIYIRTVDFDNSTFNTNGIWRQIAAGGTSSYSNTGKRSPSLYIPFNSPTNNSHSVTLYAWVDDGTDGESVAYMTDGVLKDFGGGKSRHVVHIPIDPVDGEIKEIPGGICAFADATNKEATVVLSATPTNIYRVVEGDVRVMITNFVTRTIRVGPPEPPSLRVLANGVSEHPATAKSPVEIVPISVNIDNIDSYTNRLTVTVTAEMVASTNNPLTYVGLSETASTDPDAYGASATVTIEQGDTIGSVYAYVKRANIDDTTAFNKGIRLNATVDVAATNFFKGGILPAILRINPSKPEIVSPEENKFFQHIPGGKEHSFTIQVRDAPGEMVSGAKYSVYWDSTGSGTFTAYTNLTLVGDLLTVNVKYMMGGTFDSQFYVVNQDNFRNYESETRTIRVQVDAPKVITLTADRPSRQYAESSDEYASVSLTLSEGFTAANEGYLFLVPQNAYSSNLVQCAQFTTGTQIMNPATTVDPFELRFLDNPPATNAMPLQFRAVLRSDANINSGEEIGGYTSTLLSLSVTNVMPRVTSVSMNDSYPGFSNNGGLIPIKTAKGVPTKFSVVDFVEPGMMDKTNENFTIQWNFYNKDGQPLGSDSSTNVVGAFTASNHVYFTFDQPGTNSVMVRVKDKDMSEFSNANTFMFYVETLSEPTISLTPARNSRYLNEIDENNTDPEAGRIDVHLNIAPTEAITVKIVATHGDPAITNPAALPSPNTYYVEFPATVQDGSFYIEEMDGTRKSQTKGYVFTASVTNETVGRTSGGKKWKDYYTFDKNSLGAKIYVSNVDPEILNKDRYSTITNTATLNVPYTIEWDARDVVFDLTNGLTATWYVQGEGTFNEPIPTNVTADASYHGKFTFTFTKQGDAIRIVKLVVEDKDGGQDFCEYIFKIDPQKPVSLIPIGPETKGQTDLSQLYAVQDGRGEGRVWADGALSKIEGFRQIWNYAPNNMVAWVFGYGYRAGEVDNGQLQPVASLQSGTNMAIDPHGDSATTNSWYTACYTDYNDEPADSFFYCWIGTGDNGEEGGGSSEGEHVGPIAPAVGTNVMASAGRQKVSLATEAKDEENPQYGEVTVEAIFSKEYFAKDNVGDINYDGIPDIFAVGYPWRGGRLFEAAGYTLEGGGDLNKLNNWNGDAVSTQIGQMTSGDTGDFLPSMTSAGNGSLIPNIQSNWALYGRPFTAYLEIRGFGDGLNYRSTLSGTQGPNTAGNWIGERDFTDVESNAWDTVYGLDPNWTPENRTDPTVDDTDDDGLPDGYEYYFWYHAYVGDPDTGKRLTGERFNLADIAVGIPLTSEDIAKAFNPNVKDEKNPINERDTDGDGLTDLEEFAIGTNPVHWDTDGDGISDYWEVMRGLNPLVVESDTTTPNTNPDKDYMAWAEVGKNYALLTLPDGRMFALANNGGALIKKDGDNYVINTNGTNVAMTVVAIPVYRYGDAKSTLVPVNRGTWSSTSKTAINGNSMNIFQEYTCTDKPLDASPIDWGEDISLTNVIDVLTNLPPPMVDQTLTLVHEQVRAQYGFDPRTGWHKTREGYVADRWNPGKNSPHAQRIGDAGLAVNTKAYSNLDEYLLLKYRYMTSSGQATDLSRSLEKDKTDLAAKETTIGKIFSEGTTNPSEPYADKTYGNYEATFGDAAHGADTDGDGVPDGWELYVGFDPNVKKTVSQDSDGDSLALNLEFAGTDSCNAYATAATAEGDATIFNNHPGLRQKADGTQNGWFNKFFPTDPWNGDTDGDNIRDDTEGGSWHNATVLNHAMRIAAEGGGTYTFTFIYGGPTDDGSLCIRGGGMNPCSVDTDFDLLPDPWEMCYAGVRAEGGVLQGASFGASVTLLCKRNDGNPKSQGMYITGGMDATFGQREDNATFTGDAYTNPRFTDPRTGTIRNFDFDQDGLQNFQEYLTQALRHLRYDDSETPLMGSWMPDGTPASRKFLGFLPMNIMDGETFYAMAKNKGFVASGAWQFRELGYFARPPHEWDPTALIPRAMSNYDKTGYRIMLPPHGLGGDGQRLNPIGYASTDPRMWDSDEDNMGDYYELFHGLNPLLGSILDTMTTAGDVIAKAYGGTIAFWWNAWTGWPMQPQDWLSDEAAYRDIDAIKYPWMIGTPEADADGDGIRNADEALVVNMASSQPTHTDPTPLWFTDSTMRNSASYTSQYYMRDEELNDYLWGWDVNTVQTGDGAAAEFLFSFEENEGYDTDHDWLADNDEQHLTTTPISDPLKFTDPDLRQAIWFPGDKSAAVSYSANFYRLNYASYDFLRQFTVEAWICPEDVSRDQVILERVAVYGASTLSNNLAKVRANFRLGITGGSLYGLFDTSDAVDSGSGNGTTRVTGLRLTANKWTHVALTFNGQTLALYMDGTLLNSVQTKQIPANGLISFVEDAVPDMSNFPVLNNGYTSVPGALVLGAQAVEVNGISISDKSSWNSYTNFYAGYLDEVHVWDGARTATEIEGSWRKRYSFDDVAAIRETVYQAWKSGATRNDNDGYANLPAELVVCYNFQTLPGATSAADVAWEPSGFTKNVRNLGKVEGNNVPGDIYCGWWYATPVRSTVYKNYRLVPWIPNTVGHLPLMDGSTVDSQFWSESYGGMTVASELNIHTNATGAEVGLEKIVFPNTANPYPYYIYTTERRYHEFKLEQMCSKLGILDRDVEKRYAFELRTTIVSSSDLLPLGGAFAKRCTEMWDGTGAADAWMLTKRDNNANGIPDWWEDMVKTNGNYVVAAGFDWSLLNLDSEIEYNGVRMTIREVYQRDIQTGMLPDGSSSEVFDRTTDDTWWWKLWGIAGTGNDDDDNDGLSNQLEYDLSDGIYKEAVAYLHITNYWPTLNPMNMLTFAQDYGQVVPDYFLRIVDEKGLPNYLGAAYTDHDFMENFWEDKFGGVVARGLYDAWKDADDDGWSNFAEARAGSEPSRQNEVAVDGYQTPGHPIPDVELTLNLADGGNFSPDRPVVVQAYANGNLGKMPDARWTLAVNEKPSRFIGVNSGKKVTLTLGPGAIEPGSIELRFKSPVYWTYKFGYKNGYLVDYSGVYSTMSDWRGGAHDQPNGNDASMGALYWTSSTDEQGAVGTVDYRRGIVTIDLSLCGRGASTVVADTTTTSEAGDIIRDETIMYYPSDNAWFLIEWKNEMASGNTRQTLRLSMPEAAQEGVSGGMVREGKNTIVAFVDEDGNGAYTPGEPYGVAPDVDVGWFGTSCAIELSRTAPQMARVSLAGSGETHVRVVRAQLNGEDAVYEDVLLDRILNISQYPTLTEANLLETGMLDLDWGSLAGVCSNLFGDATALTSATYRVERGDGMFLSDLFTTRFEKGAHQTRATPVEPKQGSVYAGSPTFRWTHEAKDAFGFKIKDYPAFRLRVWQACTNADEKLVYDSGAQKAPPRNSAGVYEWTAPIYAGMVTPQGWVLSPTNYTWAVSMLDAKFTEPNMDEKKSEFTLKCSGNIQDGHGYGKIDVRVKYFGPLAEQILACPTNGDEQVTNFVNLVRVQAFESPDFTGTPVGEASVTDVADIASISNLTVNATILGLKPGTYYVRAFIDTDADRAWSRWETWGYCNYVGTEEKYIYTPRAVTVAADADAPTATVYMEDADTNNNGVSDAYEWDQNGGVLGFGPIMIWGGGENGEVPEGVVVGDVLNGETFLNLRVSQPNATVELALEGAEGRMPELRTGSLSESTTRNGRVVNKYTLPMGANTETQIVLASLDGNADYKITASINGSDVPPCEFLFTVTNIAPVIVSTGSVTNDSPRNAIRTAFGDTVEIPIQVNDVAADLSAGLNVYWMGDGLVGQEGAVTVGPNELGILTTNGVMRPVTDTAERTFRLSFSGNVSGLRSATVVAEDKDGGVATRTFWYNVIVGRDDDDNDGLANSIENLINEGFGHAPISYTNMYSTAGQAVPDYFLSVNGVYLGFMFTDHDFMEDWWEDLFNKPFMVDRWVFDAWNDPDQDGWSNYAEARAGTDPTRIAEGLPDAEELFETPIPTISLSVTYPNAKAPAVSGNLVVQAYGAASTSEHGAPDAVWSLPMSGSQTSTRNLGLNPCEKVKFTLGPVVPASFGIEFRDLNTLSYSPDRGLVWMNASETPWVQGLSEWPLDGKTARVTLGTGGTPVGTVDYETGTVTVDFSKMPEFLYLCEELYSYSQPGGDKEWVRLNISNSYVRVSWASKVITSEDNEHGRVWETTLSIPNVSGRLREGKTMFVVFADTDKNGLWTPGEPYGVVTDSDVGWAGTSVKVELTDISPQILRMDLATLAAAPDAKSADEATDRGVLSDSAYYPNEATRFVHTNDMEKTLLRLRIVRSWFNGEKDDLAVVMNANGVVFEGTFDLRGHPCVTEADLLARGLLDLDWDTIKAAWTNVKGDASMAGMTNVAYRIILGDGSDSAAYGELNNLAPLVFYNAFEYGGAQKLAEPISPRGGGTIQSGQPTFVWKHEVKDAVGRKIKDYPAFRLRVWKADGTTLVYDSGNRPAPVRNVDGNYSWTAPIYANMVTPQGQIFATTNNYKWSVSMLDAKFHDPNENETKQAFRLETSGALGQISGYGAIKACVRYYGPAWVTATPGALKDIIRVQAFESPDFTGMPAGEAYVTDISAYASTTDATTPNALILGLNPGTYYLRAFIDSDGDGAWSRWETWGYLNNVGRNMKDLYTPISVVVENGKPAPDATIFMEDMDTDRDNFQDAKEWNENASLDVRGAPDGDTFFTRVNPYFLDHMTHYVLGQAVGPWGIGGSPSVGVVLQGSAPPPVDVQVQIESFSLEKGVSLTVSSDLTPGDYGAISLSEDDTVALYLVAAKTPDFANAVEAKIKDITIKANDETKVVVTAEELKSVIDASGFGDAAFFKVRLQKQ